GVLDESAALLPRRSADAQADGGVSGEGARPLLAALSRRGSRDLLTKEDLDGGGRAAPEAARSAETLALDGAAELRGGVSGVETDCVAALRRRAHPLRIERSLRRDVHDPHAVAEVGPVTVGPRLLERDRAHRRNARREKARRGDGRL